MLTLNGHEIIEVQETIIYIYSTYSLSMRMHCDSVHEVIIARRIHQVRKSKSKQKKNSDAKYLK